MWCWGRTIMIKLIFLSTIWKYRPLELEKPMELSSPNPLSVQYSSL